MRLIIGLFLASIISGQVVYDSVRVNRVYNIIGEKSIDNREETKRRMNAHTFYCTGSGTWSCQIQYSDVSASGPWTNFSDASSVVDNNSATPNGSGFGYHDFIRIGTTGTVTRVDYAGMLDIFFGGAGGRVSSVFGRTGVITAQSGDYSAYYSLLAHLHTGTYEPVDATILRSGGSYSNPTWLTALAWTKVTGRDDVPAVSSGGGAPVSTPIKLGDIYLDLTTDPKVTYIADCATTSGCWRSIGSGSATTTQNYSQAFTTQTSVALTHNAGTDSIIVQCYDVSGNVMEWNTFVKTNTSTATVTFSVATTGSCVVNSSGGGGGGGGGGDTTAVANSGAGEAILKTGTNVTAKTLVAGSNVTLTPGVDTITIASSGGGGSITAGPTLVESPAGTYNVNGAVVPSYLAASASLTFGSILNGACADLTMALSGALNGDSLAPGWPSAMPTGFDGIQFVSAANVATIRLCNHSGGTVTPAAGLTFKPTILRGF